MNCFNFVDIFQSCEGFFGLRIYIIYTVECKSLLYIYIFDNFDIPFIFFLVFKTF